jgi:hypothetical protein
VWAKVTVPDDQVACAPVRWSRRVAIRLPSLQIVRVATVGAAVARTWAVSGPPLRAVRVTSSLRQAAAGTTVYVGGLTAGVGTVACVAGAEADGDPSLAPRTSTRPATVAAARAPTAAAATVQRGRLAFVTAVLPLPESTRPDGGGLLGGGTASAYERSASSAQLNGTCRSVTVSESGSPPGDDAGCSAFPTTSKRVISPVGLTRSRVSTPTMVAVSSISVSRSAATTSARRPTLSHAAAAEVAVIGSVVSPIDQVPVPSRLTTASATNAGAIG